MKPFWPRDLAKQVNADTVYERAHSWPAVNKTTLVVGLFTNVSLLCPVTWKITPSVALIM